MYSFVNAYTCHTFLSIAYIHRVMSKLRKQHNLVYGIAMRVYRISVIFAIL